MHLASCLLIGFSVAACGDDNTGDDDDVPPCVGHLCEPGLGDAEGGNLIFEYIYFDTELQDAFQLPDGIDTATRVMAYYMSAHDPNANPLPTPGVCNNLEATSGWPLFVAQNHTDVDIGTMQIKGVNNAGTAVTIDVPKQPAGTDQIGRPHDIFYQTVLPDANAQQKPDTLYTVEFGGAGDIPATTFDDSDFAHHSIFLAGDFTVKDPDIEDDGPLIAGTDFPVAWNPGTSANLPEGDTVLGVTWLVDATGKPTHMCPTLHTEGAFTIPGTAIAEYKAIAQARGTPTDKMILLRNAIVHKIARFPNGGAGNNTRRIDMLSVLCWAQLMNVQ